MNFEQFLEKYQKVPIEEYPNQVPENPVVSVCVQTYQHAPYIRKCLDGILMQKTDFPYEILLGEDASTDGTREICLEYAKKYPDKIRLFLHRRENNIEILGSPTGRFNSLYNLYSARGKFIAICEGDDFWTDEKKLQKQHDFMVFNPDYAICGHDAFVIDEKGIKKKSKLPNHHKRDRKISEGQYGVYILTLSSFFINPRTFPKECLQVFNFDTFLFAYLMGLGHYKYQDNINPACYRKHAGGIWSSTDDNFRQISEINTKFWITKYYKRNNFEDLENYYGIDTARKSMMYMVKPTWKNFWKMFIHMLKWKFDSYRSKIN